MMASHPSNQPSMEKNEEVDEGKGKQSEKKKRNREKKKKPNIKLAINFDAGNSDAKSSQAHNGYKDNGRVKNGVNVPKYSKKGSQQKATIPEMKFENYITHKECADGLKRGDLIQGAIRINPRSYKDGYMDGGKGERDICIDGMEVRNRALAGDIVAVQLLPQDQWKKDPTNEVSDDGEISYSNKTAKVVYIIERKHPRVAAGHLAPFRNHSFGFGLFSPVDSRIPRLMIPLSECPKDFVNRPKDCEKSLFLARVVNWEINMSFASGELVRSLGEAGHIGPETDAILCNNDIDSSDFDNDVLHCLPDGQKWKITEEELRKRKDLRKECIFTIDPATARDLDDALSCKKIGDDLYEVGVHIADVSHFIEQDNALDEVAKSRATSVYLAQKVIPMLPRVLCEKLCSLNPGVERLAYSVIWNLKSDGTIVKEWFGRSVINSCVKLSYDHAQQMIEGEFNDLNESEFPPVHGNFSLQKIMGIVKNLYAISADLRKNRFDSGALKIDMPKLGFTLDDQTGMPNGCRVYEYKNSNEMIEEFMLLANMAVGRRIFKAHPKIAILRLHPPPQEVMMHDLDDLCKAFNIPFDIRDSASINSSLLDVLTSGMEGVEYMYPALTLMCAKPFQNAKYFCTGSIDDEYMYRHYALNVPIYTHFTSPIRRYPDVMVHRLLTAALHPEYKVPDDVQELQKLSDHCNDKKWAAKKASEQSSLLFFSVYVKECGPIREKGVVVGILERAIDVLTSRLGVVQRVYTDQLQIYKNDFIKDDIKPEMTLYWRDDSKEGSLDDRLASLTKQFEKKWASQKDSKEKETQTGNEKIEGAIEQKITIFSPVDLILSVKESAPTKILATLLNPHDVNENPTIGI